MPSKEEKARRKEVVNKSKYPDACFCAHSERKESDEYVRESSPLYGTYDFYHQGEPFMYPVKRCSKCGKEYLDAPLMA